MGLMDFFKGMFGGKKDQGVDSSDSEEPMTMPEQPKQDQESMQEPMQDDRPSVDSAASNETPTDSDGDTF